MSMGDGGNPLGGLFGGGGWYQPTGPYGLWLQQSADDHCGGDAGLCRLPAVGWLLKGRDVTMRALCGAIIAAGAMLGLGLTALGMGERYSGVKLFDKDGDLTWVPFHKMDTPLMFITVLLTIVLVIGLGIAFFGLAYHHHRRWHEHQGFLVEHEEKKSSRSRAK